LLLLHQDELDTPHLRQVPSLSIQLLTTDNHSRPTF
jgi:hypothetical protein